MGTGHAHRAAAHGEGFEVARGPRTILLATLALAAVVSVVGVVMLWPSSAAVDDVVDAVQFAAPGVTFPTAVVESVQEACPRADNGGSAGGGEDCGNVVAVVGEGDGEGDVVTVRVAPQVTDSGLVPGDEVKVQRTPGAEGADATYTYFGTERTTPLLVMALLFALLVIVVARWRGLFALVGLAFSGLVIWQFMLPALLTGESGLLVGLSGSAAIMFVVLYLTHGLSMRTSAALAGTLAGLLATAAVGVVAVGATRLTGITDESAGVLSTFAGGLNFQGLLACATIVAGLGVLNDVTITQSSSVWEIRDAAPTMGRAAVFASGMRIGRDHIASTIYTIAFAYAGSSLAVLLILQLYGLPVLDLLTTEEIGEEIVRTLASAIGLVLAVPLTTGIAALVVPRAAALTE